MVKGDKLLELLREARRVNRLEKEEGNPLVGGLHAPLSSNVKYSFCRTDRILRSYEIGRFLKIEQKKTGGGKLVVITLPIFSSRLQRTGLLPILYIQLR